ncbi:MAG: 2OG-Fe(II) oxygenase [Balneolaceae bacterium]|nr:2OG-Fe(II) oxygenase [Balneolaceae bacterium]
MENYLSNDYGNLREVAEKHAGEYQSADPFPNIYFKNFFDADYLDSVLAEFPDLSQKESITYKNKKEIKFAGKGERFFGPKTKELMHFLNSEPFLNFLQILTGIEEPLIADPYFSGGGQHEIKRGGLLKVHADFNKHPILELDRRINVLIYLNKNWKEEYGGHFELWDEEMKECKKKILPEFNTMAIFSTTSTSYHGHPDPLQCPEDMSRKSLALYYYSNGRPAHEIDDDNESHSTLFQERKGNAGDKEAFQDKKKIKVKRLIKDFIPPIIIKAKNSILNNS